MWLRGLFSTCGYIIGPAILLAGLAAVLLCVRASLRGSPPRAPWTALMSSLVPVVIALFVGVPFGLIVVWRAGELAKDPGTLALNLGQMCLAGLVVTALPLAWSLLLLRLPRDPV